MQKKKIKNNQSSKAHEININTRQSNRQKISEAPHSPVQHNTHPNTEDFFEFFHSVKKKKKKKKKMLPVSSIPNFQL
jgi:hypothetical protein